MKPGDLVKVVSKPSVHVYLGKVNEPFKNQILTVVEIVERDVDIPEHIVVLTEQGLRQMYKEDVEPIGGANSV